MRKGGKMSPEAVAKGVAGRAAARNRASGWLDFEIVGTKHGVERMLAVLDTALSPIGISAFLGGAVGPYLKERARDRFINEGDDVSGRWAPLKQSTVERRERGDWAVSGAHPINVRTHELQNYITQSSWAVTPTPVGASLAYPGKRTSKKSLREKVKTAQQGKTHPSTVARPVLGMNEHDLGYVVAMLAFHVQGTGRWMQGGGVTW